MENFSPNIAFFDSGQGGLTVWENAVKFFPRLNTLYLGDNARYPYGNKSAETITSYASEAAKFLVDRNARLMIVACGTASSVATKHLQETVPIPVIGIVEGFCSYVNEILADKNETIAVLATRFTIKSGRFAEILNSYGINNVWSKACPLFVPIVEEGIAEGPLVENVCNLYLSEIPESTKIVMLSCTHYPRLAKSVAIYLKNKTNRTVIYKNLDGDHVLAEGELKTNPIYMVDSSLAIMRAISSFLEKTQFAAEICGESMRHTFCTDSPAQFAESAKLLTDISLPHLQMAVLAE